jgi:hypothetical protein
MRLRYAAKETLEEMKARAHSDEVTRKLLADIKDLERALESVERLPVSAQILKLPYSSMPKLTGRRWK